MERTVEIPEDVLAEVMLLTGKPTKREAVEFALRESARLAKPHRIWSERLGLTPEQIDAESHPQPSDALDAPDIDHVAVARFLANAAKRRERRQKRAELFSLNEKPAPQWFPQSPRHLSLTPRGWQRVAQLACELDRRGAFAPSTSITKKSP